ncbi:DUF3971 domain-containing protein [Chelativorans sp. Marseille-P2723]|uniref:YhdP family protein n=1 Tax=Chelativorans sp. Marseille-P2723 TaxID=2709133 RepID=UPI001570EF10|nr:DUF3971 domain-containing protein [Chelativorans sp. Marseille-P2723]
MLRTFVILVALMLVVGAAIHVVGLGPIGNEQLRLQAERAVERLAGLDANVSLGGLRLGLGTTSLFALEVQDISVIRRSDGEPIAKAGKLRLGLRAVPLLFGRIELSRVAMAEAAFSPARITQRANATTLLDENGLLRPDRLQEAVFGAVHQAFAITRRSGVRQVSLADVGLLSSEASASEIVVEELELYRRGDIEIAFEGVARFRGRDLSFDGKAERDAGTEAISNLSFDLSAKEEEGSGKATKGLVRALGTFSLALTGREANGTQEGVLDLEMRLGDTLIGFDQDEIMVDSATARVAIEEGRNSYAISTARFAIGRTRIDLRGIISPAEDEPLYRLEMLSPQSLVAPADSPEPALPFAMRLAGRFEPLDSRLVAEKIDIRTSGGSLAASASLILPEGVSPGVSLALQVSDLPTAHVKQFWPWFAAPGARNWTLKNVFGGRVRESEIHLSVPPGRLGNGVPLTGDEVYGRFVLSDTRFDIAGEIPPVRDGEGWVHFRGSDVNVGLTSGAIYMPSGRLVSTSGGTFKIMAAHLSPRIGKLEIDVEGEAPAVVELASYAPINASRFHDLAPQDLTGRMAGHISADIPLQENIPAENLNWRVEFNYDELSIARPFEGQEVARAKGQLLVQPEGAEIVAEAELNAVPANLHIIQPFGASKTERSRHVELKLDDASRERLFPGLGLFLSGPFTVIYEEQAGEQQRIEVKLDQARLEVPWIGWRKGAGIPATASFLIKRDGGRLELSDFALRGESFTLVGRVKLDGGELMEAQFSRVRFNRNDEYSADITRTAAGEYVVAAKGAAIDARGLIRRALGEGSTFAMAGRQQARQAVSVRASFERVEGFNGESLNGVELTYATGGRGPDRLSVTGATREFGSAVLKKGIEQGRHRVQVASDNAGALLRFLDIYKHVENGILGLVMEGPVESDILSGRLDLRQFWVVNEPRMRSLVAATEQGRNGEVDVTRVHFEHGAAMLTKAPRQLHIGNGVVRGPLIGSTFQGMLFDASDNMDITGTFMPLYGFNRIFGEIPLIGQLLGNGRDRGLIGITYRLSGKFGNPRLEVNPISAIAPGFLRQLFEFR